tara:strand:+ start:967 stop:2040 length:1074 start_codon:yes stop_codon:yes gene_type:complete
MTLLFAAGDVGGARALLPVARLAHVRGIKVYALNHGVFRTEGDAGWHWLDLPAACTQPADVVLYATSVSDPAALDVAAAAQARGTPLLHMLDNWSSYAARLRRASGGPQILPDIYAVMDQLAYDEALADGVPEPILTITGHPNLAHISVESGQFDRPDEKRTDILFVSEPARVDSGAADDPAGRGYDEQSVARAVMGALANPALGAALGPDPCLHLAPHPREDRSETAARWQTLAQEIPLPATGPLTISVVPRDGVRSALHGATHVIGMSSILLYEAWLLGRPVASIQPGLRGAALRSLSHRDGLVFCHTACGVGTAVQTCLRQRPGPAHPGLRQHAAAAGAVLDLLRSHPALYNNS